LDFISYLTHPLKLSY